MKEFRTPKSRMKWFLDLITADTDALPNDQVFKLWIELRELAYGDLGIALFPDSTIIQWQKSRERLNELKLHLKSLLEKIQATAQEKKPIKVRPRTTNLLEIEKLYEEYDKKGISELIPVAAVLSRSEKEYPGWVEKFIPHNYAVDTKVLVISDRIYPFSDDLQTVLTSIFVNSLSEFPLSSIEMCIREDCHNYFIRTTLKEKRYCSDKCAWIVASRERRKRKSSRRGS
jgi:hypothetical protein